MDKLINRGKNVKLHRFCKLVPAFSLNNIAVAGAAGEISLSASLAGFLFKIHFR